jgi:uncharacterized membrane protein YsdA (DUF1294 family)
MPQFSELLLIYIVFISVVAIVLTIVDKKRSKKRKSERIPESTLMIIGFLGGALPMFITMKAIRHKTRHKKFMIGLPLIIILHVILFLLYIF